MNQPTRHDNSAAQSAADALHAMVTGGGSASDGLDEPTLGEAPRADDSNGHASAPGANGKSSAATGLGLPDNDDGEAWMISRRVRPLPPGKRQISIIQPKAPPPMLVAPIVNAAPPIRDELEPADSSSEETAPEPAPTQPLVDEVPSLEAEAPAFEPPAPAAPAAPQHVNVRQIAPDEAPPAIDVQRPVIPARRGAVVPIFAPGTTTNGDTDSHSPSVATRADPASPDAFTIARLAVASDDSAANPDGLTVHAAPSVEAQLASVSSGSAEAVDDEDDVTIMPAPATDVFARNLAAMGTGSTVAGAMRFRRTIIPILLTVGMLCGGLGFAWFRLPPDAGLRAAGPALAVTLLIASPILLLLALFNMLQVRAVRVRSR